MINEIFMINRKCKASIFILFYSKGWTHIDELSNLVGKLAEYLHKNQVADL